MKEMEITHKKEQIKIIAKLVKNTLWLHLKGHTYTINNPQTVLDEEKNAGKRKPKAQKFEKYLTSPMPARVSKVLIKKGNRCKPDQVLLILNSMKMEYTMKAPAPCLVEEVLVKTGDTVSLDQKLAIFQPLP